MTSLEERTIQDDFGQLSSAVGDAFYPVWDFIKALEEGQFEWESSQWVYRPNNFITITVHYQRAHNVTVCLRGEPEEFPQFTHLPMQKAQNGYSRFKMEEILQLDAALAYVRRAHELSKRGRSRVKKTVKIIEE